MWWGILLLLWGVTRGDSETCEIGYNITRCTAGKRKGRVKSTGCVVVFWHRHPNCNLSVPAPLVDLPCDQQCLAGEFLDVNLYKRAVECAPCPKNTYSTGEMFRLSERDMNWDEVAQEAMLLCHWLNGKISP